MGRNPREREKPFRMKASKKARITPVKAFKDAAVLRTSHQTEEGCLPDRQRGKLATSTVRATVAKAPAKVVRRAPAAKKAPATKKGCARRAPAEEGPGGQRCPWPRKVGARPPPRRLVKRAR